MAQGVVGMLDFEPLRVVWLQTREGLAPSLFDVVAHHSGALSALGASSDADADHDIIEHFGADGRLKWARSIEREGTPVPCRESPTVDSSTPSYPSRSTPYRGPRRINRFFATFSDSAYRRRIEAVLAVP